jgi:hypothetical protein
MAVAKVYPNQDVIYGLAVNQPVGPAPNMLPGSGTTYDPTQRSIHLANTPGVAFFDRVNGINLNGPENMYRMDPVGSGDHGSALAQEVDVYFPAKVSQRPCVFDVTVGYGAIPASGAALIIESPSGVQLLKEPISNAGETEMRFKNFKGAKSGDMLLRLSSGGTGNTGYLNVGGHRYE